MRWVDLFEYLESDNPLVHPPDPIHGGDDPRRVDQMMSVVSRARQEKTAVTVGLRNSTTLHLTPRAVGRGWFSGIALGERGSALVIPQHAIDWIRSGSGGDPREKPAGIDLCEVLVDFARRCVPLRCDLRGGPVSGVIEGVGADFFDLAPRPAAPSRGVTRIPIEAVHCIVLDASR